MATEEMRLNKFLSRWGVASRRWADELIKAGRVMVDGRVVQQVGTKVDPQRERVSIDGRDIASCPRPAHLKLNKPTGYVVTLHDPHGRPTVIDLLAGVHQRVFPIGRLDMDTEGLLLLTNDGDLAHRALHPSSRVEKIYQALVRGFPSRGAIDKLREGIELDDGMTSPARVRRLAQEGEGSWWEIRIHEGRKRQVRRMWAAVGHPVVCLRRVSFGGIALGDLGLGEWRHLTKAEFKRLTTAVGLSSS